MEPRDRILGPIHRGTNGGDPDGPAVVDFGDLVRKLVLFDTVIVESNNLKELGPISQKLGYEGAKALLESGRVQFVKDWLWIGEFGKAPRPKQPILGFGSYAILAARLSPPRDYLSQQLRWIDAVPGLKSKQAKKLRQLAGAQIITNPEGADRTAQAQIKQDFERNSPVFKQGVALAVSRKTHVEVTPSDFDLTLEPLDGGDWRAVTDLDRVTRLSEQQLHDVVGQGLAAAAGVSVRLALMEGFSALTTLQNGDLPLLEERMKFITRELDPDVQARRFDRVTELIGLPDVSPDPTIADIDMPKLLEITSSRELREFREWLRTTEALSDDELESLMRPVREAIARAVRGKGVKAVRLATTTGVGLILPPAGIGLSLLDTFVVDKLIPRPGPTTFLSELSRSLFS